MRIQKGNPYNTGNLKTCYGHVFYEKSLLLNFKYTICMQRSAVENIMILNSTIWTRARIISAHLFRPNHIPMDRQRWLKSTHSARSHLQIHVTWICHLNPYYWRLKIFELILVIPIHSVNDFFAFLYFGMADSFALSKSQTGLYILLKCQLFFLALAMAWFLLWPPE